MPLNSEMALLRQDIADLIPLTVAHQVRDLDRDGWLRQLQHDILTCSEKAGPDGMCDCMRRAGAMLVAPIPMVLHCPRCHQQHVDTPDEATGWTNPPHRSHLCGGCGLVWRPADVPTEGVQAVQTRGKRDDEVIS